MCVCVTTIKLNRNQRSEVFHLRLDDRHTRTRALHLIHNLPPRLFKGGGRGSRGSDGTPPKPPKNRTIYVYMFYIILYIVGVGGWTNLPITIL